MTAKKKVPAKTKPAEPAPFAVPSWPAASVEMRALSKIIEYPNNPRTHPPAQIEQLARDMRADGVTMPILVDEKSVIIAGHGRKLGALKAGFEEYPVVVARGWTDEQKRAVRIRDNQVALLSGWNPTALKTEMIELKSMGYDLPLLGFPDVELVEFMSGVPGEQEDDLSEADRAKILQLINVTIADPEHQVTHGDHYTLDKRHHLLCVGVVDDWPTWSPLLKGDALFCPYPGVFVPFGSKAKSHALVMVQPDPYIAGHILDRFKEINGHKSIAKI